jgi:hypothetical protein
MLNSPDSLGSLLSRGLRAGWNSYYRSPFFQFSFIGRGCCDMEILETQGQQPTV